MDTTIADPLVGRLLDGRYLIEARVARGGMASVYRATDERLDRSVAVKVMQPVLAESEEFVRRFIREAQSAARLSHAHVVNVFDQGRDGEIVFLVMEYVEGRNLRDVLRAAGRLTPGQALGVLEPIVSAVAAAHRAGIVHRDMKPENVLMATDGRIKVADFGLARAIESSSITLTQGTLIGSPAYLAPEQIERGVADQRADIYAIGVMAWELLTGRPPYAGDVAMAIALQHVRDDIPAPSTVVAVPRGLDELIVAATRRDPDSRPADGSAMLARLRDVGRSVPVEPLDVQGPLVPDHNVTVVLPALDLRRAAQSPAAESPAGLSSDSRSSNNVLSDSYVSDAPPSGGDDAGAVAYDDAPRPRRWRKGWIWFAIVVLLAAAAAIYGVNLAKHRSTGPGPGPGTSSSASGTAAAPTVAVPLLKGKTLVQARALAPDLVITQASEKSDLTVKKGLILDQDVQPDTPLDKGKTVNVVVSSGPILVPDLTGKNLTDAETALRKANLLLDPSTPVAEFSATVPASLVLRTTPAKGKAIAEGAAVTVIVSKGPEMVTVFDERTRPEAAAVSALKAIGFAVKVTRVYSDTVDAGIVTDQAPFGSQAPKGSTIALTVSKGPQYFTLPDFHRMDLDKAKAAAQRLGLNVDAHGYFGAHTVTYQSPSPGTRYKHGDPISLAAFPVP